MGTLALLCDLDIFRYVRSASRHRVWYCSFQEHQRALTDRVAVWNEVFNLGTLRSNLAGVSDIKMTQSGGFYAGKALESPQRHQGGL